MKKLIFENTKIFSIYLAIVISIFLISSYYYFLNDYQKLESTNNTKYIKYLISKIDLQIIHNEINRDSYEFIVKDSSIINFFETIEYTETTSMQSKDFKEYTSKQFHKVLVQTTKTDIITNNIEFFDDKNSYLFTIKTTSSREVINTGKTTILIFMVIVLVFLLSLFIILRRYFDAIKNNNGKLEDEVTRRTSQIQSTLIELEKANLKLYDMAHTDFLTKIRSRRNFFIHSENYFAIAKRKNRNFSVLMIDIDNFKTFNDTYGHDVGDKVLLEFAKRITQCLKDKDIFGRLGGEEFGISLFDTNLYNATEKAEYIRSEIEKIEIKASGKILRLTASFGASDIRGCQNLDQMIQKADSMLYSAKHSGKNRVRSRLSNFK